MLSITYIATTQNEASRATLGQVLASIQFMAAQNLQYQARPVVHRDRNNNITRIRITFQDYFVVVRRGANIARPSELAAAQHRHTHVFLGRTMQTLYSRLLCVPPGGPRLTAAHRANFDRREILKNTVNAQVASARSSLGPTAENMRRTFAVVAHGDVYWRHSVTVEAAGNARQPGAPAAPRRRAPQVNVETVIEVLDDAPTSPQQEASGHGAGSDMTTIDGGAGSGQQPERTAAEAPHPHGPSARTGDSRNSLATALPWQDIATQSGRPSRQHSSIRAQ